MNVQTLKAEFQAVITKNMTGLKMADITAARTKKLMELAAPFADESMVVEEVITRVTTMFTDPAAMLRDSVVIDGVIYPEVLDEAFAEEVYTGFTEHMKDLPVDGSATIAAITLWCGEAMLKAA